MLSDNGDMMQYSYDDKGNVAKATYNVDGVSFKSTYSFGKDNRIGTITANDWMKITRLYDDIGRVKSRAQAAGADTKEVKIKTVYDFVPGVGESNTTGLVSKVTQNYLIGGNQNTFHANQSYGYEYDDVGRIITYKENNVNKIGYTYDPQGQLVYEKNSILGQNIEYRYDAGGNITQKLIFDFTWITSAIGNKPAPRQTIKYNYDPVWKDLLKSYNGQPITYDKIGNPLTYRGMTMTWAQGRRLSTLTKGSVKSTYTYNSGGLRTSKKIGSAAKIDYTWEGSKLLCQGTGASRMIFVYDATGEVSGFTYGTSSSKYMYIKNLQGDVTGIMAASGKWSGRIVARYVYDTWGKLISIKNENGVTVGASHIGSLNPIRYRSYYYDTETGL